MTDGVAVMTAALLFLRGNCRWVAPLAALLAVGAWGGWQYFCRLHAEQSIADMKMKQLEDANPTWVELNEKRQRFEQEVLSGLGRSSTKSPISALLTPRFNRR